MLHTDDHGDGSYDPNTGMPRKTADESYDFDGNPKMGGAIRPDMLAQAEQSARAERGGEDASMTVAIAFGGGTGVGLVLSPGLGVAWHKIRGGGPIDRIALRRRPGNPQAPHAAPVSL